MGQGHILVQVVHKEVPTQILSFPAHFKSMQSGGSGEGSSYFYFEPPFMVGSIGRHLAYRALPQKRSILPHGCEGNGEIQIFLLVGFLWCRTGFSQRSRELSTKEQGNTFDAKLHDLDHCPGEIHRLKRRTHPP